MKQFKSNIVLVIVALAIATITVIFVSVVPSYRIATGSMAPTLPVGSVVFETALGDLKPGDIITFQQEGDDSPTTHTFIGYDTDESLMTKGDANPTPDVHDVPLVKGDVLGKVAFMTPVLAPSFWLSQRGIFIISCLGLGLLAFWWSSRSSKGRE